jgi:hypothetical protein
MIPFILGKLPVKNLDGFREAKTGIVRSAN